MSTFDNLLLRSSFASFTSVAKLPRRALRGALIVGLLAMVLGVGFLEPGRAGADGVTWTKHPATEQNSWRSVAFGNGIFVAVANTGINRVMTSPDGITWTARQAAENNSWTSVTFGNGIFVAVGSGGVGAKLVMTSPDGITWTSRTASVANEWSAVTYGGGLFVAVATLKAAGSTSWVMSSPDGITWTAKTVPVEGSFSSVAYGNGKFVIVSDKTNFATPILTSSDGTNWSAVTLSSNSVWNYVTFGNGVFVAVSYTGTKQVATSQDGLSWVLQSASSPDWWFRVGFGNGQFVAIGFDSDKVMTSPDGVTWVTTVGTEKNIWGGVTFGNGVFVAVSETGTTRVKRLQYPGVPTAPVLTTATCTNDEVELAVTQSSNGGSAITNYEYHIATEHLGTPGPTQWQSFSPEQITSPLRINMRALGKTPGLEYFFYVRAVNAIGMSPSSWLAGGGQSCVSNFELPPVAPVVASISGATAGAAISDNTPTVSVSGVLDGHTVTVTASRVGSPDVSCTYITPTATSCDLGVLADGEWSIVSTQTSSTGFVSEKSVPFTLVIDTVLPTPESVSVVPEVAEISVTISELLGVTTAKPSDFVVTIDGVVVAVTAVTVNGSNVVLTLATAPTTGQLVSVIYRAPVVDSAPTNNAIQDVAGNDAVGFTLSSTTSGDPKPVLSAGGKLPRLAPGKAKVMENGVSIPTTLKVVGGNQLVLKGEKFELNLKGDCSGLSCVIKKDSNGREVLELEKDGRGNVSGFGFKAGSKVHLWVFSEPRYLGALIVREDGTFDGDVDLKGIPVGQHTLQVNGISFDGVGRSADLGILIRGQLPVTGTSMSVLWMSCFLLLFGAGAQVARRRLLVTS